MKFQMGVIFVIIRKVKICNTMIVRSFEILVGEKSTTTYKNRNHTPDMCIDLWYNVFCFQTCSGKCDANKACVQCWTHQSGPYSPEYCKANCTFVEDVDTIEGKKNTVCHCAATHAQTFSHPPRGL